MPRHSVAFAAVVLACAAFDGDDISGGPLHAAVRDGSYADTAAVLDAGAKLSARDSLGYTALHRAVEDGYAELVVLLLERGAGKGEATDSEGLPMRGKAIDSRDNNQATALMLAAGGGHNEIIETLLAAGADATAADEFGLRPLHYAAESGHVGTVELLLKNGVDPDAMDEVDKTAADVARAWGFPAIEKLLGPTVTIEPSTPPKAALPDGEADAPRLGVCPRD